MSARPDVAPNIVNQTTIGYNKSDGPATTSSRQDWNDLGVPIT
jgi:hypothetical protein